MLHNGSTALAIVYTLHISVFIHPPIWRFNVDKLYRHFLPLCVIFADTSTRITYLLFTSCMFVA